jgi:hypothetical protein
MMARRARNLLLAAAVVLSLLCVGGLALGLTRYLPLRQAEARRLWAERGPRHYEIDLSWAAGWNYGAARVEMRDGRLVRALDLQTGAPLPDHRRFAAGFYANVDNLFAVIDEELRPAPSWRGQLARYHPLLAEWIDRCAAQMPDVAYDRALGFPTRISYRGTPCVNGENLSLSVYRLQPLP